MPNPEGGTDEGPSLPWQQVNVGPNNFWEVVSELFGSRDSQDPEQPDTPWSFFTPQEWSEISAVFGPRSGDEPADERPAKPWEEFANRDLFSMDSGGWNDWYSGSADWAYLKFGAPRVRTERSTARF